jgi:general secretion pathway protein C
MVALAASLALLLRVGLTLWTAMVPGPDAVTPPPSEDPLEASRKPDLAALQGLALFDSASARTALATPDALPAVNTALDLRLEGVVLAGAAANSRAMIASGERQGTYRTGDTLPAGTNVLLSAIARDHVVIDNRGQREVLWLFGGEAAAPVAAPATPGLALPPGTDQRVLKTAARLAEIISVTPAHENGRLIGYRLSPGARLKEFVLLGFETSDIVTAVNGIALNDVANLPQLYSLMDGATEVSFSLLRGGAPLSLKVTLSPETIAN